MSELIEIAAVEAGDLICSPLVTVREAMARINTARYPFQLVVDGAGRLIGTVTDGDLRRALLRPQTELESPVTGAVKEDPLTGRVGMFLQNVAAMRATLAVIPFLPILDEDGVLRTVLVGRESGHAVTVALVMAGGFGTRLGEITRLTPKPLLPVGGRPILDHILERLQKARLQRVFLSVHHLADQFDRFALDHKGGMELTLLREREPLGTAGAIGLLGQSINEPFFVINGDILTNVDFSLLSQAHFAHGNDATIAVAQYEVEVPYGVVRHGADGEFLGIDEKPSIRHFVAAGIYVLSPAFCALVKPHKRADMPTLLDTGRSLGLKIGLLPIHEYWKDIGRPADLRSADRDQNAMGQANRDDKEA